VALFSIFAALATALGATIGTTALALADRPLHASYSTVWSTWWLGDLCGALLVAPVIVLWATEPRARISKASAPELAAFVAALAALELVALGFLGSQPGSGYPIQFLCIPLFLWVAFRFGARETATAALLLAIVAIHTTVRGSGPFVRASPNSALLLTQTYMGTLVLTCWSSRPSPAAPRDRRARAIAELAARTTRRRAHRRAGRHHAGGSSPRASNAHAPKPSSNAASGG
jgi:integral membrane sensor domain MASE1